MNLFNTQKLSTSLVAMLACTLSTSLYSGSFINSGSCRSRIINNAADTVLTNNGEFVAAESMTVSAGKMFDGSGYLEAPYITITTKQFAFTGTINCSVKCIIQSEEPFDHNIFTAKGDGEFVFAVQPFNLPASTVNYDNLESASSRPIVHVDELTDRVPLIDYDNLENTTRRPILHVDELTNKVSIIDKVYYYTTPLSLYLVKGEIHSFLHYGKFLSDTEWCDAINAAIALERVNRHSPSITTLLSELQETLNYKINRIEDQVEKQHWCDYPSLLGGGLCLAAAIALCAASYSLYKSYRKNNLQYAQIEDDLAKIGVTVDAPWFGGGTLRLRDTSGNPYYSNVGYDLVRILNENEANGGGSAIAALAAQPLFVFAVAGLRDAFNPNFDNEYLPKYKELLSFVEKLQQQGTV